MTAYAQNDSGSVRSFIKSLLEKKGVDAVFVPAKTPYSNIPMPMLITDPEMAENADPLAPVMPLNAARQAASILKHPTGKKTALFLHPCELRALIELAKINQCVLDDAILIGMDCMGRMENKTFKALAEKETGITNAFIKEGTHRDQITRTCASCTGFVPEQADITLSLFGTAGAPIFWANTDRGKEVFEKTGLIETSAPAERQSEIEALLAQRQENLTALVSDTAEIMDDIEKFQHTVADCLNCYNCRTVCPVCFCKECVFNTDIFAHAPETLHGRSEKRGMIKLPSDTTMFHMTRLSHISHSCVGCGQCSSVCPSEIPVADIFRAVSAKTQDFFQYRPGRDVTEPVPYMAYKKG